MFANCIMFLDFDQDIDPIEYWDYFSDAAVYPIAMRVFHLVNSSASVERCFSRQKLIHSKVRNRLRDERVNMCIQLAFNDLNDSKPTKKSRKVAAHTSIASEADEMLPSHPLNVMADENIVDLVDAYREDTELDLGKISVPEAFDGENDSEDEIIDLGDIKPENHMNAYDDITTYDQRAGATDDDDKPAPLFSRIVSNN